MVEGPLTPGRLRACSARPSAICDDGLMAFWVVPSTGAGTASARRCVPRSTLTASPPFEPRAYVSQAMCSLFTFVSLAVYTLAFFRYPPKRGFSSPSFRALGLTGRHTPSKPQLWCADLSACSRDHCLLASVRVARVLERGDTDARLHGGPRRLDGAALR